MPLKIVCFDVETTGANPYVDRIVQLTLFNPDTDEILSGLVNPGMPIPQEAIKIHGITDAMVKDAPKFSEYAELIQQFISEAVLAGYNIKRFDVPILHGELKRAGQPAFELSAVRELDAYHLWNVLEPRNLATAIKRFAPYDLMTRYDFQPKAHDSQSDTMGAWLVINGLIRQHNLTFEAAINMCETFDRHNRFQLKEGILCWNFGKLKGKPVNSDPGYVMWFLKQANCDEQTKAILRAAIGVVDNGPAGR